MFELKPSLFVEELERRGIQLWLDGDMIRYRAPPGKLTDELKTAISARRSEIVELLRLSSVDTGGERISGAEAVWLPTYLQASFAARDSQLPHIRSIASLSRELSIRDFQAAVDELVRRHSILRTNFITDRKGQIWAITRKEKSIPVQVIDLREKDIVAQEIEGRDVVRTMVARRFNLETEPLLRIAIVRMAQAQSVVAIVAHHAIFDAMSIGILTAELAGFYDTILTGEKISMAPLPMQFSEFAKWQREWLQSEEAQVHLKYWRGKFAGLDAPFWLPTGRSTPSKLTADLPLVRGTVSDATTTLLRELCRREQTTIFVALATAIGVALARWRGRDESCVWVVHSGRFRSEHFQMIGCFGGMWPLFTNLPGDLSFLAAFRLVSRAYLESLPHMQVPAKMLIQDVVGGKNRKIESFHIVMFNYVGDLVGPQKATFGVNETETADRLDWVEQDGPLQADSVYAVNIAAYEAQDVISWTIRYNPELFEDSAIEGVSNNVAEVLAAIAAHPDASIESVNCAASSLA